MKRLFPLFVLLPFPVLAACGVFDVHQCDRFSDLDEQLTCLDSAFLELSERADHRERERRSERGEDRFEDALTSCERLREAYGDEEWVEENGEDYRERLGWCIDLWERLEDGEGESPIRKSGEALRTIQKSDRDEDEDEEGREVEGIRELLADCDGFLERLRDPDNETEDSDEVRERIAFCEGLQERCRTEGEMTGRIRELHQRTHSSVERSEESGERRRMIREGLREGRDLLEGRERPRGDEDRTREEADPTREDEERPL
ncbi:MAG: hypothetical protein VX498_15590 [Myxococcota bacterium]|nr:hypothetical protein [Myxococcota bacterium]